MTSPTLDDIQVAIKRQLETIDGLRAYATEPEQLPSVSGAIAYPRLVDWVYDQSFEMASDDSPTLWHFDIWVIVDLASGLNRAQTQLNPYIAPTGRKSIKGALEHNGARLQETVDFIRLTGGGAYGTADVAGVRCLAASMRAEVYA